VIDTFLSGLDGQLLAWMTQLVTVLRGSWLGGGFLRSVLVLVVVLYGWALLTGRIKAPIEESIKKVIVLTIIVTVLMFPQQVIVNNLYPFFADSPFRLAALLPQAPTAGGGFGGFISTSSIYTALDDILESAFVTAGGILTDGDGWVIPLVHALFIMVSTIVLIGYSAFLIVLCKMAIALLMGLSPIFIASLLFSATKGLFERWLGLLFSFALLPIFALALLSFCTQWMTRQLNALTTAGPDPTATDVAIYALATVVSFLLVLQVTQMCASIGGGLALSTTGAAGSAFSAARGQVQRVAGWNQQRVANKQNAVRQRGTAERQRSQDEWRTSVSRDLNRVASR